MQWSNLSRQTENSDSRMFSVTTSGAMEECFHKHFELNQTVAQRHVAPKAATTHLLPMSN